MFSVIGTHITNTTPVGNIISRSIFAYFVEYIFASITTTKTVATIHVSLAQNILKMRPELPLDPDARGSFTDPQLDWIRLAAGVVSQSVSQWNA